MIAIINMKGISRTTLGPTIADIDPPNEWPWYEIFHLPRRGTEEGCTLRDILQNQYL